MTITRLLVLALVLLAVESTALALAEPVFIRQFNVEYGGGYCGMVDILNGVHLRAA